MKAEIKSMELTLSLVTNAGVMKATKFIEPDQAECIGGYAFDLFYKCEENLDAVIACMKPEEE